MLGYFLSPKGRFRRRDWWLVTAVLTVVMGLGVTADMLVRGIELAPGSAPGEYALSQPPLILGFAGMLIVWPALAAGIKRWHDRDRSGWFILFSLIPLVNVYAFVSMAFLAGTPGLNRFGPDPREEERYLDADSDPTVGPDMAMRG